MSSPPSTPDSSGAPLSLFARQKVLRMLRITPHQINRWERLRLIEPKVQAEEKVYSFADLVSLKTIKQLTERGLPAARLQQAVQALRRRLGGAELPLAELRIIPSGHRVAVEYRGVAVDPLSGQIVFRFESTDPQPTPQVLSQRSAEEWFAVALECEGKAECRAEAVEAYHRVIEATPGWLEPHLNLGTLLYEQGDLSQAVKCYRSALALDPDNALAHFNLGTALDELKDFRAACSHLRTAVRLRPEFADAHYNLARVYEELGNPRLASLHWRRYLDFDSHSCWAQFARQRLKPATSRS
jgi:tetratricopeptide (TPR) repeat protein